ncbi:Beta-1,3-galactosyl-O-glycosyl-glycoprotein beta-1,6-N-acetylglucosaminyltransferase [Bulinus truncatus]|nr:Beta-1,3-galactosyl-O-glycosyl-glycoprotein beta-1,6-N-acetylglucosaminyltransferase [Bulinus truncatus]
MVTLDKKCRIHPMKLLLFLLCFLAFMFILAIYSSNSSSDSLAMAISPEDEEPLHSSSHSASLLENTELVKVIAASGILTRLTQAIMAIDPSMSKKDIVLKTLKQIDMFSVLKSSMDGEAGIRRNENVKPDIQQIDKSSGDHLVKPTVNNKPNPKADLTVETTEKPPLKPISGPGKKIRPAAFQNNNSQTCLTSHLEELETKFQFSDVRCDKLLKDDHDEMERAKNVVQTVNKQLISNEFYLNLTEDCNEFKLSRGYITCPLTTEEEQFPIAFSLVVFKDIEMVERLLRSIYRPQNYYCFHVDIKADSAFADAVLAITNCFDNVFVTSERVDVRWGEFSVLEPELICMKHLWKFRKWKYFINLTGQEFPLKTNWELVQILTAYGGANDLEGTEKRANKDRWGSSSPPHNLRPIKGSVHITVNRDFVDFLLHNQTALDLIEWVKGTSIPDETLFATLNHNPQLGIRGTYQGEPETDSSDSVVKPFLTRFKNWGADPFYHSCAGYSVRGICILSLGDLPLLGKAKHLFANKFYLWEDPIVIGCLEEMIFNNTRDEISGGKEFNTTYYSQLGFVLNKVS